MFASPNRYFEENSRWVPRTGCQIPDSLSCTVKRREEPRFSEVWQNIDSYSLEYLLEV